MDEGGRNDGNSQALLMSEYDFSLSPINPTALEDCGNVDRGTHTVLLKE